MTVAELQKIIDKAKKNKLGLEGTLKALGQELIAEKNQAKPNDSKIKSLNERLKDTRVELNKINSEIKLNETFKTSLSKTVTIDNKNFVMFVKDSSAWVENAAEEPALVAAMKGGSTMTVKATSARGTATSYTYSLSGISAALQKIQNCQ